MKFELTQFVVINAISALIALITALFAWQREGRSGKFLGAAMLSAGIWAGGAAMALGSIGIPAQIFWTKMAYFGVVSCPVLVLVFTIEYLYPNTWVTRRKLAGLFIIPLISLGLAFTNEWHNWIWTSFTPSSIGHNITIFGHGPAFWVLVVGYTYLLMLIAHFLLIRSVFTHSTGRPFQVTLITASVLTSWIMNGIYLAGLSPLPGLEITPIGIVFSGFLMEIVIVQDLITELRGEIENRKLLEQNLLKFQDTLAQQLSDQTRKLAGLYEMILLSGKVLPIQSVLEQSLTRIRVTLGCQLVCYYNSSQSSPATAFSGLEPNKHGSLADLRFEWMGQNLDLIARVDGRIPDDLPQEVRQAGFLACAGKRVRIQNKDLGIFACFWDDPHPFRVDEISLIEALSEELGVILENALMRELVSLDATQLERRRLARDLHDSVVQSLHSLVFSANTARQASLSSPEKLEKILELLSSSAQLALKEMRLLLYELRLVSSNELLFLEGIQTRLDAVERRANIDAELSVGSGAVWPQAWETDLYAISMEALNNSLKHAQATRVELRISGNEQTFEFTITDNGKGFDVRAVRRGGMGLSTMAERAERLGGRLTITSTPGAGTLISLNIKQPDYSDQIGSKNS